MRRKIAGFAAATALLAFSLLPAASLAQGESLEAIENDLSSILREMDAISAELDRIEEFTVAPKATFIRVEIHAGAGMPAPVSGRLLTGGKMEEEKEWTKAERDAIRGGAPLVFQVPFLPGKYAAGFEVSHPSWKGSPSAEFHADIRNGEAFLVKLRLSPPSGTSDPVLSSMEE